MEEAYCLDAIRKYMLKIDRLNTEIVEMEREIELLKECCKEHNHSMEQMESDVNVRINLMNTNLEYTNQVRVFQKFRTSILDFLQGRKIVVLMENRRETNQKMQRIILDAEDKIYHLKNQILNYEEEISKVQYQLQKVG